MIIDDITNNAVEVLHSCHRTGLIKAGDVIIAINGQSCDYVTLDEAVSMLKKTGEIVYLRIKKESNSIGII